MKNITNLSIAAAAVAALSGCAGDSILSGSKTGSVAPALPASTPVSRAYQVGITSARAQRCGYNFDPAKLKADYLFSEQQLGAQPDALAKIEKNYDASLSVMAKVTANEKDYCSKEKTKLIKADLNRHLAGDFNPGKPHPKRQEEDEGGLFSFGSQPQNEGVDHRELLEN